MFSSGSPRDQRSLTTGGADEGAQSAARRDERQATFPGTAAADEPKRRPSNLRGSLDGLVQQSIGFFRDRELKFVDNEKWFTLGLEGEDG